MLFVSSAYTKILSFVMSEPPSKKEGGGPSLYILLIWPFHKLVSMTIKPETFQ